MSKPIVLVVDDEAGVRESVRMVLKDTYEPVALETGDAAAEWLADHRAAAARGDSVVGERGLAGRRGARLPLLR